MGMIDHHVNHVSHDQPMSCWAAAVAMLMDTTEQEILNRFRESAAMALTNPSAGNSRANRG